MIQTMRCRYIFVVLVGAWLVSGAQADRERVLRQVDVPHDYYYREMYLPQLTSGPGSLAWSPDGASLVYSMQGRLWRQRLDSTTADALTSGAGYDFQPDWSPDGRSIAFVRYLGDALELYVLDVDSGAVTALTDEGAVNLEPRWSPDGARLAWVTTQRTGRFHIVVGAPGQGGMVVSESFPDRKSDVSRYYYSEWDHQLSPAWLPDGSGLVYVGNPETPYGTGPLRLRTLGGEDRLLRSEETSWKAVPDVSPDGRRVVYSSYLGRQWHQLWLAPIDGAAEPFPLTYGEYDATRARWSPDGSRIAFIVNEAGGTAIRVLELPGGRTFELRPEVRRHLQPMSTLSVSITRPDGAPLPARVAVTASDGRSYAPDDAWVHADDGFDREVQAFETQYFHTRGNDELRLPPGPARVTVWRGPAYEIAERRIEVPSNGNLDIRIEMSPLDLPPAWRGYVGGDVHVHMNYGGAYRNSPRRLVAQAEAEALDVVFNLLVNKEQRIPDIGHFTGHPDNASNAAVLLLHAQEFHTSFWGHMGLLGLRSHLLMPDYAAYPETAAASLYPDNPTITTLARRQGAVSGYVHPFLAVPDPDSDPSLTSALPVDAALGLVDYYEVVGFADHRASAEVWYRLMDCGVDLAAAGGTDAMANYASLRGPVGLNRTYVRPARWPDDPAGREAAWLEALQSGRSVATNGPLLHLELEGSGPGETVGLPAGVRTVAYSGFMRSAVPVDHLELVVNGRVERELPIGADGRGVDFEGSIDLEDGGWVVLRAYGETAHPLVFDLYPYATTSTIRVDAAGTRWRSPDAGQWLLNWVNRLREAAAAHPAYYTPTEREAVLANIDRAAAVYRACADSGGDDSAATAGRR